MGQLVSGPRFVEYPPIYDDPLAHMAAAAVGASSGDFSESRASRGPPEAQPQIDAHLFKLSAADLNKSPEDVFDVLAKVGEGSYGSVHKAMHKESGHVLAVKKVPVDTDLQEIIKEITIMQQCDSRYVVKYYGSYFKNSDLWIVMEYCGAGSVSDIMRLRRKTLTEDEISAILKDTLLGLSYLHEMKKIHRDVKAGNILLNMEGFAKLADFGVAGQLSDTMAKRNTVIGTPFWMAPELIQEIGYDTKADIWSLGITAIEMAEGRPPLSELHPMRAIFMIPTKPPPTLKNPEEWSEAFNDFVAQCLVKNPEERTTADELLKHEFIVNARGPEAVRDMIADAQDIAAHYLLMEAQNRGDESLKSDSSNTLVRYGTAADGTLISRSSYQNTGIDFGDGTLIQHNTSNMDRERGATPSYESLNKAFAAHLDLGVGKAGERNPTGMPPPPSYENAQQQIAQQEALKQQQQHPKASSNDPENSWNFNSIDQKFRKAMDDPRADFRFLTDLTTEQLLEKKQLLDKEMDIELEALRARFHAKRQAILDAIEQKRNSTVRF
ncbi:Non-specific serine/threonine protein kinase [Aphelenchoides fujianensis]|nr:Non-specific serine/threonine protein kinase [Aphelenchoides fujianensis]